MNSPKLAFVTGGSRGLGRGIVHAFAKSGYNIAFSYNENEEKAKSLESEISSGAVKALAVKMQVEDKTSINLALAKINKKLGKIDILVNNAGISQEKPFLNINEEDWNHMLAVNLRGPFLLAKEVLPFMISNKWGRIINISSIGGQWGGFNQVHYAAAKAGLINLTQSLAKIYSEHGITSNAIAPGLIETDMSAAELATEAGMIKVQGIPAKRLGSVEDIGSAAVYLASNEAGYITGQTINLNGGMFFST